MAPTPETYAWADWGARQLAPQILRLLAARSEGRSCAAWAERLENWQPILDEQAVADADSQFPDVSELGLSLEQYRPLQFVASALAAAAWHGVVNAGMTRDRVRIALGDFLALTDVGTDQFGLTAWLLIGNEDLEIRDAEEVAGIILEPAC